VVLMVKNEIVVANAGDSRAVLFSKNKGNLVELCGHGKGALGVIVNSSVVDERS
jgi:serine/threonine protein phosphatase PrpC